MQRKSLLLDAISLKLDDTGRKFSGYASKFGGVDSYGDTIVKGAYQNTIADRERPVQMRWNHNGPVIGKWTEIREDDDGLYVEGELTTGHSVADDAYALLKHGAVTGMSIGYRAVKTNETGKGRHELLEIDLIEISIVESPADLGAQVADIKSAIDQADSLKEIERLLRDAAGFSRTDAGALVSRIKSLTHGDRDSEKASAAIADTFQNFRT